MMSLLQMLVSRVHQSYMAASGTALITALRKYVFPFEDTCTYSTPVMHDGIWWTEP